LPKKCSPVMVFSSRDTWLLSIFQNWIQIVEKVSPALLLSQVCSDIQQQEHWLKILIMPLPRYSFLHPVLHLTENDRVNGYPGTGMLFKVSRKTLVSVGTRGSPVLGRIGLF
jgi:hypothetical protein